MKDSMIEAMNQQMTRELHAGYLYLGMAAYFDSENLPGFASWMRAQASEELEHAMKFYHYLVERGAPVAFGAIEAPGVEYDSPLAAFQKGLEHEKAVTGHIRDLYEQSIEEKDHASTIFLQWFVSEQVEEEDSFSTVIANLKDLGQSKPGLFILDKEMSGRS